MILLRVFIMLELTMNLIIMRKLLLCMGAFLFLCLTGCSNDDDDEQSYADIVGTWELVSFYTIVGHYEVPEDERDLFVFGSDRKVKVIKKLKRPYLPLFPNEDGEFDYSYNKGKQKIQFLFKKNRIPN